MRAWLTQSGLDGRYLALWSFVIGPLFVFSAIATPAVGWSYLPLFSFGSYVFLVIVGSPVWVLCYRRARLSESSESLAALLASWAAVIFASVVLRLVQYLSGDRFYWQEFLRASVGLSFFGIVVMSIAVPRLFGADADSGRGVEK